MSTGVLFTLALHSIAAVISLIRAIRDREGFSHSLRWGAFGLTTGLLGIITQARKNWDDEDMDIIRLAQEALLNLGMEAVAVYGIPYVLK